MPPLLADAAATKPVPIWMCLGILEVGEGRIREEEVLKADGSSICNLFFLICQLRRDDFQNKCVANGSRNMQVQVLKVKKFP